MQRVALPAEHRRIDEAKLTRSQDVRPRIVQNRIDPDRNRSQPADAQSQSEDGCERETGRLAELSQREADVLKRLFISPSLPLSESGQSRAGSVSASRTNPRLQTTTASGEVINSDEAFTLPKDRNRK